MSEIEDDLRTTAEAVIADAGLLQAIEQEKLALDADDPRLPVLSKEAMDTAVRLHVEVSMERELAAEASGRGPSVD